MLPLFNHDAIEISTGKGLQFGSRKQSQSKQRSVDAVGGKTVGRPQKWWFEVIAAADTFTSSCLLQYGMRWQETWVSITSMFPRERGMSDPGSGIRNNTTLRPEHTTSLVAIWICTSHVQIVSASSDENILSCRRKLPCSRACVIVQETCLRWVW